MDIFGIIVIALITSLLWAGIGTWVLSILGIEMPTDMRPKHFIVFSVFVGPIFFIMVGVVSLGDFILDISQPCIESFRNWFNE